MAGTDGIMLMVDIKKKFYERAAINSLYNTTLKVN